MRWPTSVGKARNGSLLGVLLIDKSKGPGALLRFAPERVGEEAREEGREGARERAGVPGVEV